jgi:hypothetical protein
MMGFESRCTHAVHKPQLVKPRLAPSFLAYHSDDFLSQRLHNFGMPAAIKDGLRQGLGRRVHGSHRKTELSSDKANLAIATVSMSSLDRLSDIHRDYTPT